MLTGTYEPAHTKIFAGLALPGSTVLDVGAHTGYYTLLANSAMAGTGAIHAFEPNPRNCEYLRRHVRINRLKNTIVEESAVTDHPGVSRFDLGKGSGTGRVSTGGALEVRTIRLDDYCQEHDLRPTLIKMDIEGSESLALAGARTLLDQDRPAIILSTHGDQIHRSCVGILRSHGYRLAPIIGEDVASTSEILALPG